MNRLKATDNDEANCQSHHELVEEMAQLKERERVLVSENDQLRAQLVKMKEQEKKKFDDLMVQYNMKREYEDDGTANNQVTVKTESDDEETKEVIKVEIKEEEDNDEDSGWNRCLVKKELNTVEMIEIKEKVEDGEETRIIGMETLTQDRQVKREIEQEENEMTLHNDQIGHWVKREIKEEDEEVEDGKTQIDDIEGWAEENQSGDHESRSVETASMDTTLAHPTGQSQLTVTQSADLLSPSTSTGQDETSPSALNQQTTVPTQQNKRKQQTSKRSVKRSKKTLQDKNGEEDEEGGEDIVNEAREETKIKVLHLNCTVANCTAKLDSMVHLHNHLSTEHQLSPFQCLATNCNARFDNGNQIRDHIKLSHSRNTRFLCPACSKQYDSQPETYNHWYIYHLTGQFECNLASNCAQVSDTRGKMRAHQHVKHEYQSKHLHCTHPGCTASFAFQSHLKRHELAHLATNQFHCNWPYCGKQFKLRANLVRHIRNQHFGLPQSVKKQKEMNIVDLRDPNEYVRVVVDE